jgi:hypothetical protein
MKRDDDKGSETALSGDVARAIDTPLTPLGQLHKRKNRRESREKPKRNKRLSKFLQDS